MIRFLLAAAHAEEPAEPVAAPAVDAQTAAAFADHLLAAGDARGALDWYRLSGFLDPAPETTFRIGLAYEHGERFEAAAHVYGQLDTPEAAKRAALCLHHAGDFAAADEALAVLPEQHPGSLPAQQADYLRGMLALQRSDLPGASERFSVVTGPYAAPASALTAAASEPVPHRSPALATTLSLLPGVGQLYTGHIGDGLVAMAVSGGLGLWSGTLIAVGIDQERPGLTAAGGVLAGATVVTWSSNLVGAYAGAVRFNQRAADQRAEALLVQTRLLQADLPELALQPPIP